MSIDTYVSKERYEQCTVTTLYRCNVKKNTNLVQKVQKDVNLNLNA